MKLSQLLQVPQIERYQRRNGFDFSKRDPLTNQTNILPTYKLTPPYFTNSLAQKISQAHQIDPNIQKKIFQAWKPPKNSQFSATTFSLRQRKI